MKPKGQCWTCKRKAEVLVGKERTPLCNKHAGITFPEGIIPINHHNQSREGNEMKTYTVTQNGGYEVLRTTDKQEAEKRLEELLEYQKNGYYICEQGK